MQCRDVRDLMDSLLSEQLLVETTHEILRHIEQCPTCSAERDARRGLRAAVRLAVSRSEELQPRPDFVRSLSADLRVMALHPSSPGAGWRRWLSVAAVATLAVAITAGVMVQMQRDASALMALVHDAAEDHIDCVEQSRLVERPLASAGADSRDEASVSALGNFQPVMSLNGGSIDLLHRHVCVYQERSFAHLVFRYRGELVSLLVPTHDERVGPLALVIVGRRSALTLADGIHVAWFAPPGHVAFVVARLPEADVHSVAEALAAPVSRLFSAMTEREPDVSATEGPASGGFPSSLYCVFSSVRTLVPTQAKGGTS